MSRTKAKAHAKMRSQMSTMLNLQARAFHLPHIRRYHAERKQRAKSDDSRNPEFGPLKKALELPVYVLDVAAESSVNLTNTHKNGWIQFLNWNSRLPVIAEILEDRSLASVATGNGASLQCGIVRRVLSKKRRWKDLVILSTGVLHFRGLSYIRRSDSAHVVVPLRSPMIAVRLGRAYRTESVLKKLKAALAHRLAAAKRTRRTA